MAAKGVRTIKGKEPLLRQLVFELRYRHGYAYLDRCGKILNKIMTEWPKWVVGNDVSPQAAPLFNLTNRSRFTFSPLKLDMILDKTTADDEITEAEKKEFLDDIGTMTNIIVDELNLKVFPRIGFRTQYFFPTESQEEAEKWLLDSAVFMVSPKVLAAFRGTQHAAAMSIVLHGEDCRYRVAINGVERSAQLPVGSDTLTLRASGLDKNQREHLIEQMKHKRQRQINSGFAIVVDVDAYQEDPISPDAAGFARRVSSGLLDTIRTCFAE